MTTVPCAHPALHFGSGGYYVFCSAPGCNAAWIAWKMGEDERVPGVTKGQPICGSTTMGDRVEKPTPVDSLTKSEKGEAPQEKIQITVTCPTCQKQHVQETVTGDSTRYSYCPPCRELRRTAPPDWMRSGRHG